MTHPLAALEAYLRAEASDYLDCANDPGVSDREIMRTQAAKLQGWADQVAKVEVRLVVLETLSK